MYSLAFETSSFHLFVYCRIEPRRKQEISRRATGTPSFELSLFLSANIHPEHRYAESCMLIPVSDLNLRLRVYIVGITLRFSTLDFRRKKTDYPRKPYYYYYYPFFSWIHRTVYPPFPLRQKRARDRMEPSITLDNSRREAITGGRRKLINRKAHRIRDINCRNCEASVLPAIQDKMIDTVYRLVPLDFDAPRPYRNFRTGSTRFHVEEQRKHRLLSVSFRIIIRRTLLSLSR